MIRVTSDFRERVAASMIKNSMTWAERQAMTIQEFEYALNSNGEEPRAVC
jgi:hypothetical protein